ncbi:hypothetical protein Skr01_64210 [Sphaerisporangium krabiense]|nr:hypothetical protein Skr01_64210 [Sphaerisporangium krabiense]
MAYPPAIHHGVRKVENIAAASESDAGSQAPHGVSLRIMRPIFAPDSLPCSRVTESGVIPGKYRESTKRSA